MEEYSVDTFANRDEPIPVFNIPGSDDGPPGSSSDEENNRQSEHLKPTALVAGEHDGSNLERAPKSHKRNPSLQDRLFAKLLQQVIPPEDIDPPVEEQHGRQSSKYLQRPGFSLPLMTSNFRRFNARIGIVFVLQAHLIRLFTWQRPTHTLSFLATYSFLCLHPHLLIVLPLALFLFFVFIPAYLARHPPPPSPSLTSPHLALLGPPTAPPRVIKPATEMSRDFFRNMRDLQNCMDDFSRAHDLVFETVTPWTNFSNEPRSSAVFILLSVWACLLYLAAPLLPLRHIFFVGGWAVMCLGHPAIQLQAEKSYHKHIRPAGHRALDTLDRWISSDIVMDTEPEVHEVEIFELQRRRGGSLTLPDSPAQNSQHSAWEQPEEWEPWLFSPSAWEKLAPARVAGENAKGTRFFEDVRPPKGWEWANKKWLLDLASSEWVEGRMIGGYEVEIDGERWVYDVETDGDEIANNREEWRRRRWVRKVQREKAKGESVGKVKGTPIEKKKNKT